MIALCALFVVVEVLTKLITLWLGLMAALTALLIFALCTEVATRRKLKRMHEETRE